MSWRVSKDGINVVADTEAELAIAIAVLRHDEPARPAWAVGGPADKVLTPNGIQVGTVHLPVVPDSFTGLQGNHPLADKPSLSLVVPTESDDSVVENHTVEHISVTRREREMLEAVMCFSEGVSTASLATLLGLSLKVAGSRVQQLKRRGLVEKLPHRKLWVATHSARRAKVVSG